jgi:ATP-binding cassette, subfamily B, bacterial
MRNCLRLFRYARHHAWWWLLITVLTLAGTVCSTLQPWPMKVLVDSVLGDSPVPKLAQSLIGAIGGEGRGALLVVVALAGLGVFALSGLIDGALSLAWTATGRRMVNQVAQELFHQLQHRSLAFHKRNGVADLMSRITVDSWAV